MRILVTTVICIIFISSCKTSETSNSFSNNQVNGVQVSLSSNNQIQMSWDPISGADSYEIQEEWNSSSSWKTVATIVNGTSALISVPSLSNMTYLGSSQSFIWTGRVVALQDDVASQPSLTASVAVNIDYLYDTSLFAGSESQLTQLGNNQYQISFQIKNLSNVSIHDIDVTIYALSNADRTGTIDTQTLNIPGPIAPQSTLLVTSPVYTASFSPLSAYPSNSKYNVN
jgi:hypothetical protein